MFSSRTLCALAVAVAGVVSPALFAAEAFRTWTDSSGTYTVRAKVVGYEGGVVKLLKEDGATVALPLDRLSAGDQDHVRAYDASNPFRTKPTRPDPYSPSASPYGSIYTAPYGSDAPANGSMPASPPRDPYAKPGEFSALSAGGGPAPLAFDPNANAGSQSVFPPTVVGPPVDWDATPTLEKVSGTSPLGDPPLPALPYKSFYERSFSLPDGTAGERLGGLWTDARDASAMLGLWYEPPGKPVSTRAMRIDLSTGSADPPVDLPAGLTPLGWDGRGNRVVCRDLGKGASATAKLAVVLLTRGVARTLMQVDPYDGQFEQPIWAAFCEGERLATFSDEGRLVIWSITTAQALAQVQVGEGATVRRSEDGRIVAVGYGSDVFFYDVRRLSQVGGIADVANPQAMAFSPDGTRIAVRAKNGGIWNLADMTKVVDIDGSSVGGPIFFADSRSLYDGDRMLDAETGVPMWQIKGNAGRSGAAGDRAWFVYEDSSKKARRMHPESPRPGGADAKIAAIGGAPQGDLLPPNQPMRVDVKLLPAGEDHAKVKAHLEESVRKAGHEVDENASMMLVATAFPQEKPTLLRLVQTREASFEEVYGRLPSGPGPAFPRPPGFAMPLPGVRVVESVTIYALFVTEMKLELVVAGQTLWSKSAIPMQTRGNRLLVPQGYSADDVLQRLTSDDIKMFLSMHVPRSIPRGGTSQAALGEYELTMSGLVPFRDKKK